MGSAGSKVYASTWIHRQLWSADMGTATDFGSHMVPDMNRLRVISGRSKQPGPEFKESRPIARFGDSGITLRCANLSRPSGQFLGGDTQVKPVRLWSSTLGIGLLY